MSNFSRHSFKKGLEIEFLHIDNVWMTGKITDVKKLNARHSMLKIQYEKNGNKIIYQVCSNSKHIMPFGTFLDHKKMAMPDVLSKNSDCNFEVFARKNEKIKEL